MDNDDLDRIMDKIELAVSRGVAAAMKAHVEELHIPLERRVNELQEKVTMWRGALLVITFLLTAALAYVARR